MWFWSITHAVNTSQVNRGIATGCCYRSQSFFLFFLFSKVKCGDMVWEEGKGTWIIKMATKLSGWSLILEQKSLKVKFNLGV